MNKFRRIYNIIIIRMQMSADVALSRHDANMCLLPQ